jgi:hypothetical protein
MVFVDTSAWYWIGTFDSLGMLTSFPTQVQREVTGTRFGPG